MNEPFYELPGPWSGRLAVVPRPRGGDWLEDDIRAVRSRGVDVLVSLLTAQEVAELGLAAEEELSGTLGIEYLTFPIEDRGVPSSISDAAELTNTIARYLSEGRAVALHCRSGIGRSTVLAACVLVGAGISVDQAFQRIESARGCDVPDTPEQRAWVTRFAQESAKTPRRAAS